MKRLLYVILAALGALIVFSCIRDVSDALPLDGGPPERGTEVSVEEATAELDAVLELIDVTTRGGSKRKIASRHILGGATVTKGAETVPVEPLVYLFNFEHNEGFALVAGDRRAAPILTVTDHGNLNPDKEVDNPGLAIFLENADTYYRAVTGLPIYVENDQPVYYNPQDPVHTIPYDPDRPIPITPMPDNYTFVYSDWETVDRTGVFIPCRWGQKDPFNEYCRTPDGRAAYVGCVAVAVGQIMYHYGKNVYYNGYYFSEAFHAGSGTVITRTTAPVSFGNWEGVDNYYRYQLKTITGIRP